MKKKITPYILLVPQLILGAIFIIGLGTGIIQSLGVIPAFGLTEPTLKYYKEILKEHKGKKIIIPSHIYQIYAYMNNIKFKGNIKGILLYAGTNEIINKNYQKEKFDYKIQDKYFSVRILDLNKEWENIKKQLNEIIAEYF